MTRGEQTGYDPSVCMSDRITKIRASLERQRRELVAEGDVALRREDDRVGHEKVDDDAAPLAEMEKVIASNRNRERAQRLVAIDAALARLAADPDEFGLCEACDEEIPTRRLELLPWTRRCTACQDSDDPRGAGSRKHLTDYR